MNKLLFVFLLISLTTFGQETGFLPGYIVTNKNDTIQGLVKNIVGGSGWLKEVRFDKGGNSKTEKYSALELKGFRAGGNVYASRSSLKRDSSRKTVFVKVIVDGPLSYFELTESHPSFGVTKFIPIAGSVFGSVGFSVGGDVFYQFIQMEGDPDIHNISDGNFTENILAYLKDEPELCDQIQHGIYKKKDIVQIVKDYNLLKYKPEPKANSKTGILVFFKMHSRKTSGLVLQINDSIEYTVGEKYLLYYALPEGVKSKICYGTKESKSCDLFSPLPYSKELLYYELHANGAKTEFYFEQQAAKLAAPRVAELRKPTR